MVMEAPTSPTQRWDSALETAYREHRGMLYGVALRVLHDRGEAEDCVHDTLLRLWQRGHSYTPARGSLAAFLVVCVRNEALTRLRKRANRARIEHERLDAEKVEPPVDEPIVERSRIADALASLSPVQRETLQMAYFNGLTHEQIAKRMHEPVGTVKSRLSMGLRALRAYFKAQGEER
jgi:RNA polymerase sigma-70 factor (ECF subfamily)